MDSARRDFSPRTDDRSRPPALVCSQVVSGPNFLAGARPDARQLSPAVRAAALGGELVGTYQVTKPLDDRGLATRAAGIFPVPHLAGQVAGIDKPQSLGLADLGGADQGFRRG